MRSRTTLVMSVALLDPLGLGGAAFLDLADEQALDVAAGRSRLLASSGVIGWTSRPKSLIDVLAGSAGFDSLLRALLPLEVEDDVLGRGRDDRRPSAACPSR